MSTRDLLFIFLAVIVGGSGLFSVLTRHVVHAALWLVVCLGALAACYLVLGAELVALVQLLIYVGAVVVLVIFALMLTRAPIGRNNELMTSVWQRVAAAVVGAAVAGLLGTLILPVTADLPPPAASTPTQPIAAALFGVWVWPFELLSMLLLVSLIGAFAVSAATGAVPRRRTLTRVAPAPSPAPAAPAASAAPATPVPGPAAEHPGVTTGAVSAP